MDLYVHPGGKGLKAKKTKYQEFNSSLLNKIPNLYQYLFLSTKAFYQLFTNMIFGYISMFLEIVGLLSQAVTSKDRACYFQNYIKKMTSKDVISK